MIRNRLAGVALIAAVASSAPLVAASLATTPAHHPHNPTQTNGGNQTKVVFSQPGRAQITDPSLMNSWGLPRRPKTPIWVTIHAYDPRSRRFLGTLTYAQDRMIMIDGLWGLLTGDAVAGGPKSISFTSGPDGEQRGLLRTLTAH